MRHHSCILDDSVSSSLISISFPCRTGALVSYVWARSRLTRRAVGVSCRTSEMPGWSRAHESSSGPHTLSSSLRLQRARRLMSACVRVGGGVACRRGDQQQLRCARHSREHGGIVEHHGLLCGRRFCFRGRTRQRPPPLPLQRRFAMPACAQLALRPGSPACPVHLSAVSRTVGSGALACSLDMHTTPPSTRRLD